MSNEVIQFNEKVTNIAKGQQCEITLKLGLQSTEAFSADTLSFGRQ